MQRARRGEAVQDHDSGNREAIAELPVEDLEKILMATLTGTSVDEFAAEAKKWVERTNMLRQVGSRT